MYLWTERKLGQVPAPPVTTQTASPAAAPRRRACQNPLDARANAIIAAAQDPARGLFDRGVATIWSILRTYYPSEAGKVSAVVYVEGVPGLRTTRVGTGPGARGVISVGRSFLENTTAAYFARRVLQVGHELRHIDQWRAGMIGSARKAEREFLAHCWTALAAEKPGTGCMYHATRVGIIDAALGNLQCLDAQVRAGYAREAAALMALRSREQAASGRAATAPPATCAPSH
jgi:hypothetical protein